ncbi:ABC-three component system middle component 2 [Ligilactobacillus sp. Marseille-Q7487]|uniref:ABC-three component system middle component 2 n=1 Tax=Ligilactobacillus sp. Marseille-Q7487 TaxID=3022128 RepID=UPI0024A7DB21|nr:ABC-three component system middle component 2 [Ligilactobacillus sp. Marseille-Q7487]
MKLFNSRFELALRVILILKNSKKITKLKILALDLMSTYGKACKIANENLHGNNQFDISEIAIRKKLIDKTIAYLRLCELAEELYDSNLGYTYRLTNNGRKIIDQVNDDYAERYQGTLRKAIDLIGKRDDEQLFSILSKQFSMKVG